MLDQTDLKGLLGVDGAAGEHQLHGGGHAYDALKALGAAETGSDAQPNLRHAEGCLSTEDQKDAMHAFLNKEKITTFKNR